MPKYSFKQLGSFARSNLIKLLRGPNPSHQPNRTSGDCHQSGSLPQMESAQSTSSFPADPHAFRRRRLSSLGTGREGQALRLAPDTALAALRARAPWDAWLFIRDRRQIVLEVTEIGRDRSTKQHVTEPIVLLSERRLGHPLEN